MLQFSGLRETSLPTFQYGVCPKAGDERYTACCLPIHKLLSKSPVVTACLLKFIAECAVFVNTPQLRMPQQLCLLSASHCGVQDPAVAQPANHDTGVAAME